MTKNLGEFNCNTCGNSLSLINCEIPTNDCQIYKNCSFCELPFIKCDNSIYACLNCKKLLHKSCVNFPQQIHHPFHPHHHLTLRPRPPAAAAGRPSQCRACGGTAGGPTFRCTQCEFALDVNCASLVPANPTPPSVHFGHPHPLINCENPKIIPYYCFGCSLEIRDTILVCLSCNMLLHELCAELPREIRHSLHASHFLTLYENSTDSSKQRLIDCKACLNLSEGFGYRCVRCKFYLDLKCTFAHFPMIKSELHHHSLALFTIKSGDFRCKICFNFCTELFFHCARCNFNSHVHCLLNLPAKVKHKCHLHWLSFTKSWIKDHEDEEEDAELYCDACEEKRRLIDPTYYCEECHCVAHAHCVIYEVLPHLQRESYMELEATMDENGRDDEVIGTSDYMSIESKEESEGKSIVGDIDKEIKMLQLEIDLLTAKLHKLKQSIVHQQH